MTHEEAIREYIARRLSGGELGVITRDSIRSVRFGVGDGWGGSDVTPGEPDWAAVEFKVLRRGDWVTDRLPVTSPADLVRDCLAVYEEDPEQHSGAGVDEALRRVTRAVWGGSRRPVPENRVLEVWVDDARLLAAEVLHLRALVARLKFRRFGRLRGE